MLDELSVVVLSHDIKGQGLAAGDLGIVVHCYKDGKAAEVEFVNAAGGTAALVTLEGSDVRPVARSEILHVRDTRGVAPA